MPSKIVAADEGAGSGVAEAVAPGRPPDACRGLFDYGRPDAQLKRVTLGAIDQPYRFM